MANGRMTGAVRFRQWRFRGFTILPAGLTGYLQTFERQLIHMWITRLSYSLDSVHQTPFNSADDRVSFKGFIIT